MAARKNTTPTKKTTKEASRTTASSVKTPTKKRAVKESNVKISTSKVAATKNSRRKNVKEEWEMESNEQSLAARIPSVTMPSFLSKKPSKRVIATLATLVVLGGLLYLLSKYAIVGWVDNKPLTRFQLYSNLEQRYGQNMREELIVEQLVNNEAKNRNVDVTDNEVDQEIKVIEEMQGGPEAVDQYLQASGRTRADLTKGVRIQLLSAKMFGGDVNISDEQVKQYIEQNKEQIPAATEGATQADKDKLTNDVRENLRQEQIQTKFNEWLRSELQGTRVKRV